MHKNFHYYINKVKYQDSIAEIVDRVKEDYLETKSEGDNNLCTIVFWGYRTMPEVIQKVAEKCKEFCSKVEINTPMCCTQTYMRLC